jgi:hypothetical protein
VAGKVYSVQALVRAIMSIQDRLPDFVLILGRASSPAAMIVLCVRANYALSIRRVFDWKKNDAAVRWLYCSGKTVVQEKAKPLSKPVFLTMAGR